MMRAWAIAGWAAVVMLLAIVAPTGGAAGERPARVASINLCTDQLLIRLFEPERIASVSFLAADPRYSAVAEEAAALPLNYGLAEEILRQDPDLVLAGAHGARASVDLLRRLGYRVLEVPLPPDLNGARRGIREVAQALGVPERGEALIEDMNARLRAVADEAALPRPSAVVYEANGITLGGGGLAQSLLEAAGLRNLAAELGIIGPVPLSMERVVMARPDVLILQDDVDDMPARATAMLRHPALEWLHERSVVAVIPRALWSCGGPEIVEAVVRLTEARKRAAAEGG